MTSEGIMGINLGQDTNRTWMESIIFYLEKVFSKIK